jgi:hypothetical protein
MLERGMSPNHGNQASNVLGMKMGPRQPNQEILDLQHYSRQLILYHIRNL